MLLQFTMLASSKLYIVFFLMATRCVHKNCFYGAQFIILIKVPLFTKFTPFRRASGVGY